MTEAYPLHWPANWPRHQGRRKNPTGSAACGFVFARDKIAEEVRRMNAEDPILSTNCRLLLNGKPRGDEYIQDPGAAIYFTLKGRQMVMAADYFNDVGSNIWRLAMALSYLRGLERHGGGTMLERAFSGFAALPDPTAPKTWREILGVTPDATLEVARVAYREAAMKNHPDRGGDADEMARINNAWEQAQREMGAA